MSLVRFLLEAGFIILAAVAAGLARLSALWIGVVMFGAWLLVAFVESAGARGFRRRRAAPELAEAPEAEEAPAHVTVTEQEPKPEPEPEPAPEPEREPVLAAVPPPPEPEPVPELEPEPEPEPVVVPLALRDPTPRTWNLWELEELAASRDGDPARVEERGLLLLHMRQFANAAGELPAEFDPLVRGAFGSDLAELVT
jgi:type IV secretory pathway VirB10-like protein